MKKNWFAASLAYFVIACSGGQGDQMNNKQVEAFAEPEMKKAAALLLGKKYSSAIESARISSGIDALNQDGRTLLLIAIRENDREGVRALLAAGADPNVPIGRSPIAAAVELATPEIVADLLSSKADPDGKVGSEAALWRAAVRGNFKIAELLLQHGAKIDNENANGATPALAATQAMKYRMAVFLIQQGASPFAKSKDGISISEWAANSTVRSDTEEGLARQQLLALLRQAGAMQ